MTDRAARRHLDTQDDTVDYGLTDDLLGSGDLADPEVASSTAGPTAPTWPDLVDDEDYLAPPARRGKLTTGLLIALIFMVGVLVGTTLKSLAPAPAPQVVYVLSDSGTSAPPSAPPTPR